MPLNPCNMIGCFIQKNLKSKSGLNYATTAYKKTLKRFSTNRSSHWVLRCCCQSGRGVAGIMRQTLHIPWLGLVLGLALGLGLGLGLGLYATDTAHTLVSVSVSVRVSVSVKR